MTRSALALLFLILAPTMMFARSGAVPLIVQPLVPPSVEPGSGAFTLTVNGAGFGPNAAVYWNGSIRSTTVLSKTSVQAQITAADVANKGTAWVTVANPSGVMSNVVYFSIRSSDKGLGFLKMDLGISNAGQVVVGDFNNDGKLDIAVQENGYDLDIFLGKGNATFRAPIPIHLDTPILSMVTGDFNGDGNLDLAALQYHRNAIINVFLGHGDGTFTKLNSINAESHASLLGVGDFDGDGNLDLYVDGWDRYDGALFKIKHGNGDGTFTDSQQFGSFGDNCINDGLPAIADFNGDGLLDIATINSCGVVVFLNSASGFVGGQYYPVTFGGSSVVAADLNGDGKVDLVTDGVSILLGNGDGTFNRGVSAQNNGVSVNVADFSGDGKLDIAADLSMLLGNGDGTFRKRLKFAGLFSPGPLNLGDFNGDGKLDLLGISGNSLVIFEQVRVYLTPIAIDFGTHLVGKTSQPKTASLTNFNANPLTITNIDITGANAADFAQTNNCGTTVPPNGSCEIKVTFTAGLAKRETAQLEVTYQAAGTLTMPLSGIGRNKKVTVRLAPSILKYGRQPVGMTSPPQTVTLTNTGDQAVRISDISATAPFAQTNNCPSKLPVGSDCKIKVVFTPTATGTVQGQLSVTDDAQNSPQTVALSGVGISDITLSPKTIDFGNQKVHTTSVPIPVALKNISGRTVTIRQIKITGTNAEDFAQTNDCGHSVPPKGQCTIMATFTPTAKGHRSAQVSVNDDGGGSPQKVLLSGVGT